MKFRIFRSAEDQTGAGSVDPTEAPRMGGQVLPEITPSKGAAAEPRVEDATPRSGPAVVDRPPVGPIKIAAREIGATALSADRRIYWRANQGESVDFALPGVELPLPDAQGEVRPRSGTSYAVPYLVAQLSQSLHEGSLSRADWLGGRSVPSADLGASGRDPVYGWGLPQVPVRCG